MLISYKRKFIYIQIWKTGSTSAETVLKPHAYQYDLKQRGMRFIAEKFRLPGSPKWNLYLNTKKHSKAAEIQQLVSPKIFKDYFKFAIVRNPFDWLVSMYTYILQTPSHRHYELARYLGSFEKYIKWRGECGYNYLQKSWICDNEGNNLVDFIGNFETLKADFRTVGSRLNLDLSLPHLNKSIKKKDYREYYTSTQLVDYVVEHYKEDFEYFKYSKVIQ